MEADSDFKVQTRFEKYAEFVALQNQALSLDSSPHVSDEELGRRVNLMWGIIKIVRRKIVAFPAFLLTGLFQFAEYQEQAYLLDPFLEELVGPIVKKFKSYTQGLANSTFRLENIATFDSRLELAAPLTRVSSLLYNYLKFRGHKTISQSIRTFSNSVQWA